jgi:formylglycine-generating enzyme required for sulfatase activity
MRRRYALLIGNLEYEDETFRRLRAPGADVPALADLLGTPHVGDYEVHKLLDEPHHQVQLAIARLLHDRDPDDLVLLYFSGHGVLDYQGRLWLAVRNTLSNLPSATGIGAAWLKDEMDHCRARRQVLMLDCCYSGAFSTGAKGPSDIERPAIMDETFGETGRGRVVLTATDKTSAAWEGDRIIGGTERSLFTHYVIEGIRTGAATDERGLVTAETLYRYVYREMAAATDKQHPRQIVYDREGEIVIARGLALPMPQSQMPDAAARGETVPSSPEASAESKARQEWIERLGEGFEPIPFESPLADRPYGVAEAPIGNVVLGRERVPFSLPPHQSRLGHRIIELHPQRASEDVARDIRPAELANVVCVYILLSGGDTRRIRGEQRFEGKPIGRLHLQFSDGQSQIALIRLGIEVREWVSGDMTWPVVTKATAAEEVWCSPDQRYTLDMLRVDIEGAPKNVIGLAVVADCRWLPADYREALPSIRVSGVTYKTQLASEPKEISPRITQTSTSNGSSTDIEPRLVRIPAGPFLMGSTDKQIRQAIVDGFPESLANCERPQHRVELSEYFVGMYPITNAEYQLFLLESGHAPPTDFKAGKYPAGKGNHPVVAVTWEDAVAYCRWLSTMTRRAFRLPTEAEWEKAARGPDGRIYPWGNDWDPKRANIRGSLGERSGTTPVGQYSPDGDSSYGCADMAGNVYEWCLDWHDGREYRNRGGGTVKDPKGPSAGSERVLRGGAFYSNPVEVRVAARSLDKPQAWQKLAGFRVAMTP